MHLGAFQNFHEQGPLTLSEHCSLNGEKNAEKKKKTQHKTVTKNAIKHRLGLKLFSDNKGNEIV